jgi:predicted phosphoribosyltransferase
MRDDVLMNLVDRALTDPQFRARAQEDLEGTLRDEGFDLTDEELAAVKEFHQEFAGLSDEEVERRLQETQRQQAS